MAGPLPCYGADRPVRACPAVSQSTSLRHQGETAARPSGAVAEEPLVARPCTPQSTICSAGTPPQPQLLAVRRHQIDEPVPRAVRPRHRRVERHRTDRVGAAPTHLVGHLVALGRTAGPDESPDPLGRGAPLGHGADAAPTTPAGRPAPSGVDDGEDAGDRIDQRHAARSRRP